MNVLCRHLITPLACLMAVTVAAAEPRLPVIAPRPPSACGCQASSAPLLPIPDPIGGYDENVKCKDKDGNVIDPKPCGEGETASCHRCDVNPLDGFPDNCNGQCGKDGGPGTAECFQCKRKGKAGSYNNDCFDPRPELDLIFCNRKATVGSEPDNAVEFPYSNARLGFNAKNEPVLGKTSALCAYSPTVAACYGGRSDCGWQLGYRVCSVNITVTIWMVLDLSKSEIAEADKNFRGMRRVYGHEQQHVVNFLEGAERLKAHAESLLESEECYTYQEGDAAGKAKAKAEANAAATRLIKNLKDSGTRTQRQRIWNMSFQSQRMAREKTPLMGSFLRLHHLEGGCRRINKMASVLLNHAYQTNGCRLACVMSQLLTPWH